MTANRDLKRRVRDRQAETGESYVTALRQVLAQRPDEPNPLSAAIPTVEYLDITDLGALLGMKCRVTASPAIAHSLDLEATLHRFLDMLVATKHDPALATMRAVTLRGERVQLELSAAAFQEGMDFVRRLRAGLNGVSNLGRILALRGVPRSAPGSGPAAPDGAIAEPTALFSLWLAPMVLATSRPPLLIITSLDEVSNDPLIEMVRHIRARRVSP